MYTGILLNGAGCAIRRPTLPGIGGIMVVAGVLMLAGKVLVRQVASAAVHPLLDDGLARRGRQYVRRAPVAGRSRPRDQAFADQPVQHARGRRGVDLYSL